LGTFKSNYESQRRENVISFQPTLLDHS